MDGERIIVSTGFDITMQNTNFDQHFFSFIFFQPSLLIADTIDAHCCVHFAVFLIFSQERKLSETPQGLQPPPS